MERWMPVEGYEGRYEISSLGRVKSVERRAPSYGVAKADSRLVRERVLKPGVGARGYAFVTLCEPGRQRQFSLARLVASHFVGKPAAGAQVNHLNGDKLDNRAENLAWATARENIHHARDVLGAYIGSNNGRYVHGRRCGERKGA